MALGTSINRIIQVVGSGVSVGVVDMGDSGGRQVSFRNALTGAEVFVPVSAFPQVASFVSEELNARKSDS